MRIKYYTFYKNFKLIFKYMIPFMPTLLITYDLRHNFFLLYFSQFLILYPYHQILNSNVRWFVTLDYLIIHLMQYHDVFECEL